MGIFLTLLRRELAAFFLAITGYVIIASVTLLISLSFVVLMTNLGSEPVAHAGDGNVLSHLFFLADPAAGHAGHHDAAVRAGKSLRHV